MTPAGPPRPGWLRRHLVLVGGVALVVAAAAVAAGLALSSGPPGPIVPERPHIVSGQPVHLPRLVPLASLDRIRAEVAASGHLPTDGTMVTTTVPPTESHFAGRDAYVYLPPVWFSSPRPHLPVLMLLPGQPGNPSDWSQDGDADLVANAFAHDHDGTAPIVAMPDPYGAAKNDTECLNTARFGNAETYLVDDVPAALEHQFGADVGPGSLAVAGLSAGGTCSVVLTLTHPSEFRTFASFSGFATPTYENDDVEQSIPILYGGSQEDFHAHDPLTLLRQHRYDGIAGWFEGGTGDPVTHEAAERLAPAARAAGIETCVLFIPGGHDFGVWAKALDDAFPWLVGRLGLTPPPTSVPATCS